MIDTAGLSTCFRVRRLNDADADGILFLCEGNPQYYLYCNSEPSMEQVLHDLRTAPPGVGADDKYFVGFFRGDELVAVMDLIDGYPGKGCCYIGFFMMNEAYQGKLIGSAIIDEVCAYLTRIGKRTIRLAFAEDNPQASHFWKKNGFIVKAVAPMDGWTALVAERDLPGPAIGLLKKLTDML
ncbi:MAG: GNAT family N-acetyltransferase [Clostridia bacterium]|nr:GNAT family N-acetyltransferase [Clostridia bacterium]